MSLDALELPKVDLVTGRYYVIDRLPDGSVHSAYEPLPTEVSPLEEEAMGRCLVLGERALALGNPPVGAVLLDHESGERWEGITVDKSTRHLHGHAEIQAYDKAQPTVGNDLSNCTLVTTSVLCDTCATPYAEGKIGRIVCGVTRAAVWKVAGIMRPRRINMHELLLDGDINTTVTIGFMAEDILRNFALYAPMRASGQVNL